MWSTTRLSASRPELDVTGDENSAFGWQAGQRVTEDSNSTFGALSGSDVDGGTNSAFGSGSGNNVTGAILLWERLRE